MYRYTQLVLRHCFLSSIFHKIRVLIISIMHQSFIFILFVLNFRWPFSSSFGRTMERFIRRLHQRKLHKGSMFSFIISQSKKYIIIMLDILWNTYLLIRKWNKCFILNVLGFQRWEALSCSSRYCITFPGNEYF